MSFRVQEGGRSVRRAENRDRRPALRRHPDALRGGYDGGGNRKVRSRFRDPHPANNIDEHILFPKPDADPPGQAILEVDSLGAVWVIDATLAHGVDRHPLDTLLADFVLHQPGAVETFEVWRLKDNHDAACCVERAKHWLGEPYDEYFKPTNGRHYCTELVYDSFLDAKGAPLFETVPMNFKNKEGEMPEYWVKLFARLGEEVPQGVPGTNPQMMRESPNLVKVLSWTR